ncbi:hypothetical protein CS022_22160 [Veronia nyctiphanis]|uniref:MacB-like periplasmic core domain-containing protein n=1 Tax=Veronia nyctiphanis TaxID=1278244 RepID=A0A4Q0YJQ0_9GAMM|nr:ABC transporter permease [Veronia nyctiphanis]RXJ70836.1 hypothetical protein CS022_22160 [Veronia nyctiphanis]
MMEQAGVFGKMGEFTYFDSDDLWVSTGSIGESIRGLSVSKEYSSFNGRRALLGRPLSASDFDPSAPPVVVISNWLWQQLFAGNENVVGQTVFIDSVPSTVVGVMPEGYSAYGQLWRPYFYKSSAIRSMRLLFRPSNDAHEQLVKQIISERMTDSYRASLPQSQRESVEPVEVVSLSLVDESTDNMGVKILIASLVLVVAIVLVAAINISNLLLARALQHQRDAAIRAALGASSVVSFVNSLLKAYC